MSNKFIFFFSLICLSLITKISSQEIIPKYGKKKTNNNYIYLDVSGFDDGEKIYISITADTTTYYYRNSRLEYKFCTDIGGCSATKYVDPSSSSSTSTFGYEETTYNYKIKKDNSNAKYLYMTYNFYPPVTVENTENDATKTLIIVVVVVSVVVLAVIIVIIVCCCRRCRRTAAYGTVPYPVAPGYGVSPYAYGAQPVAPVAVVQPVMQPAVNAPQPYYDANAQYNAISPAPITSDVRVNQNQIYAKPA
jgi:hypothetical protein